MDIAYIYEERQNVTTIQQWMSKNLNFVVKIQQKIYPGNLIFQIFSYLSIIEKFPDFCLIYSSD